MVVLGAYSNYLLIISAIVSIVTLLTSAFQGSVGNLIASVDKEKVYEKYKQIRFVYSYVSAFVTICFFVLIQPFISKWTGGGEYVLEFSTVIILSVCTYLRIMRQSAILFKDCAGLFWQDRFKPIIESIVNIVASIVLVHFMGINGIFIGTLISIFSAPLWMEPRVLYKQYFKRSTSDYWRRFVIDAIIMVAVGVISYFVCSFIPHYTIWLLILKFAVCIVLVNILLVIAYLPSKEFKGVFAIIKDNLLKMFKRKNKS